MQTTLVLDFRESSLQRMNWSFRSVLPLLDDFEQDVSDSLIPDLATA